MKPFILGFLFAASAFSQDGITVSVSRTVAIEPDEAGVNISAITNLDVTGEQVIDAFKDAGATPKDLIGQASVTDVYIATPNGQPPVAQWVYQMTYYLPAARLKEVSDKLAALRTNKPAGVNDISFSAWLNISEKAVEDARQKALADLLADARRRAQTLARTGGLSLGALASLTEFSYATGVATYAYISTSRFSTTTGTRLGASGDAAGTRVTFSLTARFTVQGN